MLAAEEKIPRWTAEEDDTLARLIAKGASAQQIAIQLGRSRNSVCGRIHRKKLHPQHNALKRMAHRDEPKIERNRFTPDEDKIIVDMAAVGKSGFDIGEALNRHKSSVVQRARLLGAKLNGQDGPKARPTLQAPKSQSHEPEIKHVAPALQVTPLMVALVDLQSGMCRFPVGDPLKDPFGFCGLQMRDTGSYCRAHARLCYTAPEARRRAA